jgi:hypothetical protein
MLKQNTTHKAKQTLKDTLHTMNIIGGGGEEIKLSL